MPILFSFKQLAERECDNINICWKVSIITTCLLILITGMASTFSQGYLTNAFGGRCVLFANLSFVHPNNITNTNKNFRAGTKHLKADNLLINISLARAYDKFKLRGGDKVIDKRNSDWGEELMCNICQYVPTLSTVQAVIWAVLFTMCSRGGKSISGLGQPVRIVLPSLFFFVLLAVISTYAASNLTLGLNHFCLQFYPVLGVNECTIEMDKYTLLFAEKEEPAHSYVYMSISFSWMSAVFWGICVQIMILRILFLIDYDIMTVTVIAKRIRRSKRKSFDSGESENGFEIKGPSHTEDEDTLGQPLFKPFTAVEQRITEKKQRTSLVIADSGSSNVDINAKGKRGETVHLTLMRPSSREQLYESGLLAELPLEDIVEKTINKPIKAVEKSILENRPRTSLIVTDSNLSNIIMDPKEKRKEMLREELARLSSTDQLSKSSLLDSKPVDPEENKPPETEETVLIQDPVVKDVKPPDQRQKHRSKLKKKRPVKSSVVLGSGAEISPARSKSFGYIGSSSSSSSDIDDELFEISKINPKSEEKKNR